jgi:regulator of replication initiation timing
LAREGALALAKVAVRGVDLEPIDRLEEKVKLLVGMIDRLRADQARAADEHSRLTRELDGLRARLAEAEGASGELTALREERALIRSRVGEMLTQIESLNL